MFTAPHRTVPARIYVLKVHGEMDPSNIKWGDSGAEYVVESTGAFTGLAGAGKHMAGEDPSGMLHVYVVGHLVHYYGK